MDENTTELLYELDPLDLDAPPEVWAEFVLCFDVDFDMDIVAQRLGIPPTQAARMSQCRFNAYTGTQNPGYWEISTPKSHTFKAAECLHHLCVRMNGLQDEIVDILREFAGAAFFRLNIDTETGNACFPDITVLPEDVCFVSSLKATLEIIID